MKLNKSKRIILSLALIIFMVLLLGQNIIYAAEGSLNAALDTYRYLPTYDASTNQYTYNSTKWGFQISANGHKIYQINELDAAAEDKITGQNSRLYCLNARVGDVWNNNKVGEKVEYTNNYDFKSNTDDIKNTENYSALLWLLDNFYIPNVTEKEDFFQNIGITKDNEFYIQSYSGEKYYSYHNTSEYKFATDDIDEFGYVYMDSEGKFKDALLPDDIIETVQQAAIWHFSNYLGHNKENIFNNYTANGNSPTWLYYMKDEETKYSSLAEYTIYGYDVNGDGNQDDTEKVKLGKMYQQQAAILYNYLVDNGTKAIEDKYSSNNTTPAIKIEAQNAKIEKQTDGKYKAGPLKITTTGKVSEIKVTTTKGTTPTTIKVGEDFYVSDLPSNFSGDVKISVSAKGSHIKQTLWKESGTTHQPIVKINSENPELKDEVTLTKETYFDLALRKTIIGVKKGTQSVSILNENGLDATRNITVDTTTIPSTATYKHRKDPVVVGNGYIVKYKLSIFNEGDIDGYASIIVDQLPTGLASTLKVGDIVTSSKGNEYKVTSYSNNKLVLTINSSSPKAIAAYDSAKTIDSDTLELECKVTQKENTTTHYLTNIAYINEAYSVEDGKATKQEQDRKSTESKPAEYPDYTADNLNNTDKKNLYHGDNNYSLYNNGTNNDVYFNGQEDDDDFETVVIPAKEFDLKLVKYISAINGDTTKGKKVTKIDTTKLAAGERQTAEYTLSKDVVPVEKGDYVTYTFRVYNEGDIDGYVTKLTDNIPVGLQFVQKSLKNDGKTITVYSYDEKNGLTSKEIEVDQQTYKLVDSNNSYWTIDKSDNEEVKVDSFDGDKTPSISINVEDYLGGTNKLLNAYDSSKDTNYNGDGLTYVDVKVTLKVSDTASLDKVIRNEAAITGDTDSDGKDITDRDSQPENWPGKDDHDKYQDDEDFDNIKLLRFDIALRKFITAISSDSDIKEGDYVSTRAPQVDTSKLKTGEEKTAIYNHSKEALIVNAGDYVLYTIRVYNEGDLDGYASKITDYLPEYLNYIDGEFNKQYGWKYNSADKSVTTTYLSSEKGESNKLVAFDIQNDDGNGAGLSYKDVQILCRVSTDAKLEQNITNIAEITEYQTKNGIVKDNDMDSDPSNLAYPENVPGYEGNREGENASATYYPGQEDDDDFDRVLVHDPKFDLALRKFITKINENEVTTRIPEVSYEDEKITYTHSKDVVKVVVGDIVTYTIRVYNEGKTAGYAKTVTDDIPEYLEYLPKNSTNIEYKWKMYDKDGNETEDVTKAEKIVTDYTANTLLKEFNPSAEISDTNPEFVDVKVAFKVKDPDSSKYIIKNKAQISEDADKNGNSVEDIDSEPDKWNDGEDDQDYENVSVEYFDLSLLKYVSEVQVTENGKTTTTKTGNKGDKNDIVPKVEIHRKKLNSTTVKFIYTIKITNEGDIPGYATEITDYVPEGLEFNVEDNKGWEEIEDRIIATTLLSDTLLKPGESATVKVTFRWINDEDNMGVKTNIAEISEDENEKDIPDRDSTPGNKKDGEDDIDDAEVVLSIKTGITENIIAYITGGTIILLSLASGVILIKKFVL